MRHMTPSKRRSVFRITSAAALAVTALLFAAPARAQTAAVAYERAQTQEREALAASPPSPETLRKVARAYEAIAYRYPVSGYSDNALWQAADLFERAFGVSGLDRDRDAAGKDLGVTLAVPVTASDWPNCLRERHHPIPVAAWRADHDRTLRRGILYRRARLKSGPRVF